MAEREIVWLRKADADFQAVYERFEERGEGKGDGLFQDVNSALERISLFPEIGRTFESPIRRVLIDQGRYGLFYVAAPTRIVILGIENLRQDPARIRQNLGLEGAAE